VLWVLFGIILGPLGHLLGSSWRSFWVVFRISWGLLRHLGAFQGEQKRLYHDTTGLGGLLRCLEASLGSSWALLGTFGDPLGGLLGSSWGSLGVFLGILGHLNMNKIGCIMRQPALMASWGALESLWDHLGASWGSFGDLVDPLGRHLGSSWGSVGVLLRNPWDLLSYLGALGN